MDARRAKLPREQMARRILIVDDDSSTRRACARSLGAIRLPVDTAATIARAAELLENASRRRNTYAVVVLDLDLRHEDPLAVMPLVRRHAKGVHPSPRIFAVSSALTAVHVEQLLAHRAVALPRKGSLEALRRLARQALDGSNLARSISAFADDWGLTPAERSVIGHALLGRTDRDTARRLNLSERTIEGHWLRILRKRRVRTRTLVLLEAIRDY